MIFYELYVSQHISVYDGLFTIKLFTYFPVKTRRHLSAYFVSSDTLVNDNSHKQKNVLVTFDATLDRPENLLVTIGDHFGRTRKFACDY